MLNRVELPGTQVRYKLSTGLTLIKNFSNAGEALNVSKSGIAFKVKEKVKFGTPVQMKLSFPDGKDFNLKGRIRWQNSNTNNGRSIIGVQFNAFGQKSDYNPLSALEYLRQIKELSLTKTPRNESDEEN